MSHEIRTPMNGIVGFSKLLTKEGISPEKIKYYSKIISESSKNLLSVVNDILEISKIESGNLTINNAEFNLNDLISGISNNFRIQINNKFLSFHTLFGLRRQDSFIVADEFRINQVLTNFLNNALKFTKSGEIELGYKKEKDLLYFYVKDTGKGIKEEDLSKIFKRFFQSEPNSDSVYKGTGLGLSICKSIVDTMGGKIGVKSEVGIGSEFYFSIPYNSPEAYMDTTNDDIEKCVVVAEDEINSFSYINEVLSELPLRVIHVFNGKDLVNTIEKYGDISLILMDIRMPEMDGLEAAKIIKSQNKNIPIIVQSAYIDQKTKEKVINIGCEDYINKPYKKEVLIEIVKRFV
jgi:CheY-like chemotaxis protein